MSVYGGSRLTNLPKWSVDSLIKIAVAGARGRVGRCIVQLVQEDPQTQLFATILRPTKDSDHTKNDQAKSLDSVVAVESMLTVESLLPVESILPVESEEQAYFGLASIQNPFDVFIDFSTAESLDEHLTICCQRKHPMVIGVTGLSPEQKNHLSKASKIIPIVYSPNMSIGVNVCFKLLEIAAKALKKVALKNAVGVAIHETHRFNKKDLPSGTALRMGEIIAETWGENLPIPEINFASNRVADIMGEHTVLFALQDERLEIMHKAENRMLFARGAIEAAKWLHQKPAGLYDMQDVLSLK